jgi:hypothetical protein
MDWARKNGQSNSEEIKDLTDIRTVCLRRKIQTANKSLENNSANTLRS